VKVSLTFFWLIVVVLWGYQDGCTAREAIVLSSLLSKVSLPVEHAGVAIIKLCQMPYTGTSSMFLKTLLNKKYSLPLSVVAQVVQHLSSFHNEQRTLPVAWHQTFLVFAQRYKTSLTGEQKEQLKSLLKVQQHHQIANEIRRELFGSKHTERATETRDGEMLLE
jgi:essential nuclear protein 1